VDCLGSDGKEGSVTVIGAVSPPGGDLSEPVTQNTLRVTKVFWGLDAGLAYKRHFPAINWLSSYSLYVDNLTDYWQKNVAKDFEDIRREAMALLQQEAKLEEIVRLVGTDALSGKERLSLLTAKSIREDFLFQNAYDYIDAYTPLKKQYWMLKCIITVNREGKKLVEDENFDFEKLASSKVFEKLAKAKEIPNDQLAKYEELEKEIIKEIQELSKN